MRIGYTDSIRMGESQMSKIHMLRDSANPLAILAAVAEEVRADPNLSIAVVTLSADGGETRWSQMKTSELALMAAMLQRSVMQEIEP